MTHHIIKCPHCGKVLEFASGSLDRIGTPFRKCPYCGGICEDLNTMEWITRSPSQRRALIFTKPFAAALLSSFFIGGIAMLIANNFFVGLIVAIICFIAVLVLGILIFKSYIKDAIEESLQRTKSAAYVKLLQETGYHIFPIKGVEVGSIDDFEVNDRIKTDEIKTEIDTTYGHH